MQLDHDEAQRLEALRTRAYSRDGSSEELSQLRALEQKRATPEVVADEMIESAPPEPPVDQVAVPRVRRRAGWIALIAALTVVVAGIGFALGRVPAPTTIANVSASAGTESQHGVATLALLDSPQTHADVPSVALDGTITARTIHLLTAVRTTTVAVYGARSSSGQVCLIAVTSTLDTAETCSSEYAFIHDGIHLRFTTNQLVVNDRVPNSQAYWEYYWTGDGRITGDSNVSPVGATAQQ